MGELDLSALRTLSVQFESVTVLSHALALAESIKLTQTESISATIEALSSSLEPLEAAIWDTTPNDTLIASYHKLFQLLEQLIAIRGDDHRHHFVITIPVADRPQHLRNCLGSIHALCSLYHYGGKHEGHYNKLTVVIADDSREQDSIDEHQKIAEQYNQLGITTIYFGQTEQQSTLANMSEHERVALINVVGANTPDAFFHKGASITRNIAYLKLNELALQLEKPLFYFIDSDQEFKVTVEQAEGERPLYAINYLYQLDRIFSETDATILTGKVVGDPPVSPSVMAGNFLEDLIASLHQLSIRNPSDSCTFHDELQRADDAAYHDMADLFGFKPAADSYRYYCTLKGEHDHSDCLNDFSDKLNRFFDGEHPTRKSLYEFEPLFESIKPARTIYTGNYIFKPQALEWFIPFATLKLRMAGPTLGRMLKASIDTQFVSANLPMLHKRTVDELGESEFRPGIDRNDQRVDLSAEFERQFFGDVMLFTMEALCKQGFPDTPVLPKIIGEQIEQTGAHMQSLYTTKHQQIIHRIEQLKALTHDPAHWWNDQPNTATLSNMTRFIDNIDHNFGTNAEGYRLINDTRHLHQRYKEIQIALSGYEWDRISWRSALEGLAST
ncbi:hypothetical protein BOW53_01985 [Solemya pervernicosa gill symbiont]|uniref:Uncharacterized protein n=2 Tax=Gammaproteobacteria incertae sedis TaxID=118884 RepID=A0A1T2LA28_9GAMM|nr:hypothetical protein [Candidatus Reidiella endopervernicosa]OOZ41959.1 hypothetical protein BOW53_01985 [Solemya pervernicosa gill symbiont]QKQ24928.1 hypothetical protein HUE57_00475 [Candidatus Reidiella endopervernicosa]